MKKILVCALVLVMCITAFVACNPTEQPDLSGLNGAKDYIVAQFGDVATDTSADYQRPAKAPFNGTYYDIAWTVAVTSGPATGITVTDAVDGFVTIDVDEFTTEDIVYTLTATVSDGNGNTVTATFNHKVPAFNSLTVAEFIALEDGEDVYAIVGYVMASGANPGKTGSFVIADETGAIFSYNKFEVNVGDKIVAWGSKTTYSGTPQLTTTEVMVIEANSPDYAEATPTVLDASDINLAELSETTMEEMNGTFYKINGVTLVTSGGYTNANYNGSQLLQLYTNDEIVAACADFYNCKVNVYGYVRGFSGGKYLTIQVTRIEWGEDYEYVPSTPASRVEFEKKALELDNITVEGDVELPTVGSRYADTTIEWALSDTTAATLEGNVLTVAALPEADVEITLTATLKNGDVTDTKAITIKVCAPAESFIKKALTAGAALEHNTSTTDSYIIIGTVAEITSAYSEQYKNVTFTVTDGTNTIIIFRYNLDDAATIKAGDSIAIAAPIKKYNDDIEAVATFVKLDITSLKDAADAGVAGTGADGTMIYGTVKEITSAYSEQYNNITITLTDGTNDLSCYRLAGGADIAVGDYLLVTGTPSAYKGAAQMAQGATYNKTGVYVAPGTPEPAEKVTTIADALTAAVGAEAELSGTVVEITEAWSSYNNMSFYISDGTNKILVYRGVTQVGLGDVVTVTGTIGTYSNSNQIAQGSTAVITTAHVCSTYTDATCTDPAECTVCGKENGEALGHTEANNEGKCDRCGADLSAPQPTLAATISFADTANRTSLTNDEQVWAQNGITVTNAKASSTSNCADYSNPARFYKSSSLTIAYTGITKLVVVCGSSSYATALVNSITADDNYTVTADGSNVIIAFVQAVDSFTVESLTGGQVRVASIDVYTTEA